MVALCFNKTNEIGTAEKQFAHIIAQVQKHTTDNADKYNGLTSHTDLTEKSEIKY